MISCSSSDSVLSFWFKNAGWGCGDFDDAEGGGVNDGDVFSWWLLGISII